MIRNIFLFTTNRCDLHCQQCLEEKEKWYDFPLDLLDGLLTQALPFGARHVGLTGGEPCMHPQFSRLVDTIVRYGYTWGFVSNGQRTEPYLTLMKKHKENFSSVNLSIDSAIPEIHDQLRMKKGAFDEVVNSARKYVEEGFVLRVNSSLNKRTKTEVKALIELAEDLGAAGIKFAGIILGEQNKHLQRMAQVEVTNNCCKQVSICCCCANGCKTMRNRVRKCSRRCWRIKSAPA